MYSSSLFAVVPVVLFFLTCTNPSVALVVGNKHNYASTRSRTMTTHANSNPRRTRTKHVVAEPAQRRRRAVDSISNLGGYLGALTSDHDNILAASDAFSTSAQNARSNSNEASRQDAATHLERYRGTLAPLSSLFANLAADKGLAYYDNSDQYETLLKDIVNVNKNALSDTSDLVNADPTLGPLLGPTVYAIKCILDDLLDITENATDAILNPLSPLLKSSLLSATDTVCHSMAPPVLGLCLQV